MKINSVKTLYYSPRSNGLCEKSHSTLLSVIGKLMNENSTWELLIPQALASVRFAVNLSTGYSPYFLLFGRDVIFLLDTVLQPRRKYQGEDPIHSILQLQHQAFTHVHRNLQKARKRQKRYADKNAQRVEFKVGSPVYCKNFRRTSKFKNIPLYELKQRLQARKERNESMNKLESDQSVDKSENQYFTSEEQDDMKMDIDLVDRQTKNSGLNLLEKGDQKKESVGSEISPMEKEIDLK